MGFARAKFKQKMHGLCQSTIQKQIALAELKSQFDFSNKAWDTAMKGLAKKNLLKVSKENDELLVRPI